MQPHTLKSTASAAEVFSVARRHLQVAVDAANHLGLVVPDSFPDAIDHLRDWTTNAETEVRELLHPTGPLNQSPTDQPPGAPQIGLIPSTVAAGGAG